MNKSIPTIVTALECPGSLPSQKKIRGKNLWAKSLTYVPKVQDKIIKSITDNASDKASGNVITSALPM